MRRRGKLRDWIEYAAVRAVCGLLATVPLPAARRLADLLSDLLRAATPRWRRIARRNLELAFPERSAAEREALLRGSYRNLGRVLLAVARLPQLTPRNVRDWIEYEGYEHFERALARGRGVIFLTAHLGNWELSSAAHALFGHPLTILVRPLDNPLLDRWLMQRRAWHGNRPVAKDRAARASLRALQRNEAVGVLADQNVAGEDGVFVDFFGLAASATPAAGRLAVKTGAAVIPGFAFWNEGSGRYVLKFYGPIALVEGGDARAASVENAQRCQAALERAIRERPEQWLWMHRRWKRRPPGEPSLY